jgi:hypothetical protein
VTLPELLDCRGLQRELGITRAAAERIMRHVPKVLVPGLRKVYVKRADVEARLHEWYSPSESQTGGHRANGPAPAPGGRAPDAIPR